MPRFSIRARPEPSEAAGNTYSDPHPDDSIDEMVVGAGCDGDWCAGGAPCAAAHPPSSQQPNSFPASIVYCAFDAGAGLGRGRRELKGFE